MTVPRALVIALMAMLGSMFSRGNAMAGQNAYNFSFHTLEGNHPLPLADYRGKVILVVNTASKCGFTPQYAGLEKLYLRYKSRGLVIVGVPSNDFLNQEPGDATQIAHFCKLNYGVTFPMAAKVHVRGDDADPFYKWAYAMLGFGTGPKWNFHKYLIARDGTLVDYFNSTTAPDSQSLVDAVEEQLDRK